MTNQFSTLVDGYVKSTVYRESDAGFLRIIMKKVLL